MLLSDVKTTIDANGNITSMLSLGGSVVERYTYEAYGRPSFWSGSWASRTGPAQGNRILFGAAYFQDRNTDLYFANARYYHSTLGRFISRDPLADAYQDGPNLYQYVGSNPSNWVDPTGMYVEMQYITPHDMRESRRFYDGIVRALQKIAGDCATIKMVPADRNPREFVPKWGKLKDKRFTYFAFKIVYEDEINCCDPCWNYLKSEVLDSKFRFVISPETDSQFAHPDLVLHPGGFGPYALPNLTGGGRVFMDPGGNPLILDFNGVTQTAGPDDVVLWHELVGHAATGFEHNWIKKDAPRKLLNMDWPNLVENLYRKCLIDRGQAVPFRYPWELK